MSVTHGELSAFTYRQLRQYTHEELDRLSSDELLALASVALSHKTPSPFTAAIKSFMRDAAVNLVSDGLRSLLLELVKQIINLP